LRSACFIIGLVGTTSVFIFASFHKTNAPPSLAPGVVPLTAGLAWLAVGLAFVTAVAADLTLAHSYHMGMSTFNDVVMGSAGRSIAFGPIGIGVFAFFYPDALRDLNPDPPSPSSTLGLGA
jgi:hypothetical protein